MTAQTLAAPSAAPSARIAPGPARRRWRGLVLGVAALSVLGALSGTFLQVTPGAVQAHHVASAYIEAWNTQDDALTAALTCAGERVDQAFGEVSLVGFRTYDDSSASVAIDVHMPGLSLPATLVLRSSGWAGWCVDPT